jgi:hypothetical protein
MPADFHIDAERRVVYSKATGMLTPEDAQDHMDRLVQHPDFRPEFDQLFDFRDVTKSGFLRIDVVNLSERTVFSPKAKRAFVVSTPWQYGYSRMFATLRDGKGETGIVTFRSMKEALSWLSLSEEPDPSLFKKLGAKQEET